MKYPRMLFYFIVILIPLLSIDLNVMNEKENQQDNTSIVQNNSFIQKTGSNKVHQEKQEPIGIAITAYFTDDFVKKYKYEDAKNFSFAIKINGHYYNTYRNKANGVSNSIKHGLTGAVPAYLFKDAYTWHIPFGEIKVANKQGSYGFNHNTLALPEDWIACGGSCFDIDISPVKEGIQTHHIDRQFYFKNL